MGAIVSFFDSQEVLQMRADIDARFDALDTRITEAAEAMKARAEEAREASCARIAGQQQAAKIALAKSESSSYDLVKQIISDVSRKNDEKMAQMAAQVRSLCERVAATEMDLTEMCAKLKEAETKSVQALAYAQEAKSICEKREQEKAGDVDLNESIRRGLLKRQRQFSFRPRTNALHPMK